MCLFKKDIIVYINYVFNHSNSTFFPQKNDLSTQASQLDVIILLVPQTALMVDL